MRTADRDALGPVLVAGVAGGFGRRFARLLRDRGSTVTGLDLAPGSELTGDIAAPDGPIRAELGRTGCLILCVPDQPALEAYEVALDELAPDALVVDLMSVKGPVAARSGGVRTDLELLSLNPLFAPDLGFSGQAVATVPIRPGPRARALLGALERAGARLVVVDAAEHDRRAAAAQVAVHAAVLAYGAALVELDVRPQAEFSTPPSRVLLALLARIVSFDPEVYRHIQVDNPAAPAARRALADAVGEIGQRAQDASGAAFGELFEAVRVLLGEDREALAEHARRMLLAEPGPSPTPGDDGGR